ncbi:DNA-binding protein [Rhodococcus sp. D2-41]|uniref:MaoC family dehydratase N-terminal domain-containing protein n=1 Tax=Speluncibacter jeojiensis TaxID=2710754 RepID=A0A9X4RGB6_9ACTN|nr:MaoC family dehydratase N-terminal domain-containing protein [Rhodococcus sp. D2-41]MDG3009913.1 DNA-binding protein [Rhodococcus sp. D2-41]MDG3017152.1 MaoC family dehydratase N-terminal domain-containing protein [Corynebacteriales bacterium D3-21]
MSDQDILDAAQRVRDDGGSARRSGRDPINQPMVNNWVEAIGDRNPIYVDEAAAKAAGHAGVVAPPAMAQVWTMRGLGAVREADDPLGRMTDLLNEAGFTSVVATNCNQTYHRYLSPGDEVTIESVLEDVVGPKKTGLGEGWFFTTRNFWRDADGEVVAEMEFRILKFRPPVAETKSEPAQLTEARAASGAPVDDLDGSKLMRPQASRDTQFFWDGVAAHELRLQKLEDGTLQHPPVPALWKTKDETTDYVVACGRGTVYSFIVHHAPKVPGRQLPFVIALVELEEGVRMLGELRGVDPDSVEIGQPVTVDFLDFPADPDNEAKGPWTLYAWRPADHAEETR